MWEYLVKKIKPSRPDKEPADIHPARAPHDTPSTREVHADTRRGGEGERRRREGGRRSRRRLKCPVDGTPMELRYIGHVEVDQCPACLGIFLDRGELKELQGEELSSFTKQNSPARTSLIYTPHGLSDHIK